MDPFKENPLPIREHKIAPLISIVIVTHNRAKILAETIDSALMQDYPAVEVVIVDDGSTDETAEMFNRFSNPRLSYFRQNYFCAPAARNRGIIESKGEYILWLDSGDVLLKGVLQSYSDKITEFPDASLYYGNLFVTDVNLNVINKINYKDWYTDSPGLLAKFLLEDPLPLSGSLVKRACYATYGYYDESFRHSHNYEWCSRIASLIRCKLLPRPVVKCRGNKDILSPNEEKVVTSFQALVVNGLLARHPLRELTPEIDWDRNSNQSSEAKALITVAIRLISLGDLRGGLKYLNICFKINPDKQLSQLILEIENKLIMEPMESGVKPSRTVDSLPKVLFIVHDFLVRSVAGTELYTLNLARTISKKGVEVTILYPEFDSSRPVGNATKGTYDNVTTVGLNLPPKHRLSHNVDYPDVGQLLSLWLDANHFDLVHFQHLLFWTTSAVDAVAAKGIPLVLTLHDTFLICDQIHMQFEGVDNCVKEPSSIMNCATCYMNRQLNPSAEKYENVEAYMSHRLRRHREIYQKFHKVLVPSLDLINRLRANGFENPATIHSTLGMNLFQPQIFHKGSDRVRFLFIGNIAPVKGLDILLQAFSKVDPSKASLDIYGKIRNPEILEDNFRSLSDNHEVRYRGSYGPEDLPEILSKYDVLIIPSRFETYPTTAREALHAGVPIIASNVGGLPELIEDGSNGLLFEAGNMEDLAEKMTYVLDNQKIIDTFRQNIKPVKGIEEDASKIINLYVELIK